MSELYDHIGYGYVTQRRPDPRIYSRIRQLLRGISSLLNVGAGSGSYEPNDLSIIAAEPSTQMISQRPDLSNVVQAKAEALPFKDGSFDATMAILTIHHWRDKKKGLEECARVTRTRMVILTWDPTSDGFWLVQDYFPDLLALDRTMFPSLADIKNVLGHLSVERLFIPADCVDGFLGAYWRQPHAYLDAMVRSSMSSFSRIADIDSRIESLRKDLASGAWERKHKSLFTTDALDIGYRLISVELGKRRVHQ